MHLGEIQPPKISLKLQKITPKSGACIWTRGFAFVTKRGKNETQTLRTFQKTKREKKNMWLKAHSSGCGVWRQGLSTASGLAIHLCAAHKETH